ncbi:MAG TPA: hypothetical protein VN633_05030 [Bryobacteraceae bacterium]|nr:hypothetical protein [Bryobacteraceae bacterium]
MLSEADMQVMPDVTHHRNKAGDVIRHELLGPDEWMVIEATLAGAGKSYCHTYPDAWKLSLRRLRADGSIDWTSPRIIRFQDTGAFPDNMVLPYLEPLKHDRVSLGLMSRSELAAQLRWMADQIESGASTRASLNYEPGPGDDFSVNAAVTYSLEGQGDPVTDFIGQRYVSDQPLRVVQKPAA